VAALEVAIAVAEVVADVATKRRWLEDDKSRHHHVPGKHAVSADVGKS
jgi:hypothetical protein